MPNRQLHRLALVLLTGLLLESPFWPVYAEAKPLVKVVAKPVLKTYTYKTVGDLEIKADVYQYNDKQHHDKQHTHDAARPAIVWLHGGALIMGGRAGVSGHIRRLAAENGYVLVSFDYRLAPETKLPQITADIEDAFRWLRAEGPKLFHLDPKRIAVSGGSAGGYLTLLAGHRVRPRVQTLVAFWGYGDLATAWATEHSPHARHRGPTLSRAAFQKILSGPPITDSRRRQADGGPFYQQSRRQGVWVKTVSGFDPAVEPEKLFSYMPVKNVEPDYPPTVMIHGTRDTDVPYEQSVMMARQFKKHGVVHELISVKNGEHGLAGADPAAINAAYQRALAFVVEHLEN